jgi:hypothetical protein
MTTTAPAHRRRTVAAIPLWAAVLFAFWIALTDNTRPWELVAGGVCALLGATALSLAALAGGVAPAPAPRWLLRSLAAPWWIVRDSALVLGALAARLTGRPLAGRLRPVVFPLHDDGPREQARRALAFGVGSAGPNQYVVTESPEEDVLLVHELVATGSVSAADVVAEP